jgi:hypothetical protein
MDNYKALFRENDVQEIKQDVKFLRQHKELFKYFCEHFVKEVIGFSKWTQIRDGLVLVSQNVTIADEAFARLCVENYTELCRKRAEGDPARQDNNGDKHVTKGRKTKFETGRWTRNGEGTRVNGGWHPDGIKRYKELLDWVKEDRSNDEEETEKEIQEEYKSEKEDKARSKKKRKITTEQEDLDEVPFEQLE